MCWMGRTWVSGALATLLGACAEEAGLELPVADSSRILLYFPVGDGARGLVRGRGRPHTFPPAAVHTAAIRTFPSADNTITVPVGPDGGFDFAVVASGREILEVSALGDDDVQGPAAFVQIPPRPLPVGRQLCCRSPARTRGRCVLRSRADQDYGLDLEAGERESSACPTPEIPLFACEDDRDCLIFERRHYELDPATIELTPPDPDGQVTLSGTVEPNALVLLENRRLTGVGRPGPIERHSVIAAEDGTFRFENLSARGDDEFVLEMVDLNDFRSAPISLKTPDAAVLAVDIVEAWPVTDLNNGAGAILGLRFFVTGQDDWGMCPDNQDLDPAYCFSGGLDFDDLRILSADINGTPIQMCPAVGIADVAEASCSVAPDLVRLRVDGPLRGVDGDVRAPPRAAVILVDLTRRTEAVENRRPYFLGLVEYVRGLPRNFEVGLAYMGGRLAPPIGLLTREGAAERLGALGCIDRETGCTLPEPAGRSDPFQAVFEAATAFMAEPRFRTSGRILLTALATPELLPDTQTPGNSFERALSVVQPRRDLPGIPVDVVAWLDESLQTSDGQTLGALLDSLAAFSGSPGRPGRTFRDSGLTRPDVHDVRRLLRDARGTASGGFLMLYELLPATVEGLDSVGKLGDFSLEVEVRLQDAVTTATYRGPMEFLQVDTD